MIVVAVVLGVGCIVLGVLNIAHNQNARSLKRQVDYLTKHDTNAELTVAAPDRRMEEVFLSINRLLRATRERQIEYINKEIDLRKQMSNISHDLRTPLTSILGYIELAKDATLPEEEREAYMDIVEKRAKVLQELITGVYDLSRLEEDKYLLKTEEVKVNQILYDVLALYYNEFESREYIPDIQIDEEVPVILGDKKAMLRIYSNIMQNVLRHGTKNLRVRVKAEKTQIVTIVQNDSDEITKEDLPKIFGRFYVADRMHSGQNTGLGLAIVKSLTEHMGGQVDAIYDQEMFGIRIIWPIKKSSPDTLQEEQ